MSTDYYLSAFYTLYLQVQLYTSIYFIRDTQAVSGLGAILIFTFQISFHSSILSTNIFWCLQCSRHCKEQKDNRQCLCPQKA